MDEGNQDTSWIDSLPEPLRAAPFISKAESPEDAFNKIQHAANYTNRAVKIPDNTATDSDRAEFYQKIFDAAPDLVRIPPPEADEDTLKAFHERFGVPEKTDDYTPADTDNWDWDEGYVGMLRTAAHAAGLNTSQFKAMTAALAAEGVRTDEAREAELAEAKKALKTEWGEAADERFKLITNTLKLSDAPPELIEQVSEQNITVEMANWLYQVADSMRDPDNKNLTDDDDVRDNKLTPQDARDKIAEILRDPDYFNAASPRQKYLIEQMHAAQKAANAAA